VLSKTYLHYLEFALELVVIGIEPKFLTKQLDLLDL
jgi:hypothetical protein